MLNTTQTAALARTSPHTVKREIARGNLRAEKIGGVWVVDPAEAGRWAAQFQPYAGLRKRPPSPAT